MNKGLIKIDQQYVTLAEAADLLGVSKATLRNWDRSGKLSAVRHPINSYRLYDLAELKELQNQIGLSPQDTMQQETTPPSLREVRRLIARLQSILRNTDSQSTIIGRFDEITKLLFAKAIADRNRMVGGTSVFDTPSNVELSNFVREFYGELAEQYEALVPIQFRKLQMSDSAIAQCVNVLRVFDFASSQFDVQGVAYEEVIRNTFDKGDHQQFFTPPQIVEFTVSFCEPFIHGDVCDPASGTGGFVASVARRKLGYTSLTSMEIDERLSWVSGINMILHGGRNIRALCLSDGGTLGLNALPYFNSFDTVLTNSPFGSDFMDRAALETMELGRGRSSRRRGILFLERCHSLLRDGGTLAIILDEGVLSLDHAVDVRHFIAEKFELRAVISLPETAFMPYASVNASILVLSKPPSKSAFHSVFFAKAEKVGRKPNGDDDIWYDRDGVAHINSDLPTILAAWHEYHSKSVLPDKPNVYVTDVATNSAGGNGSYRLDFSYHHPSRQQSREIIAGCAYTVHKLGEICQTSGTTVIPSKELADTLILYTGLANIEAFTGVAEQVLTPANSLKSAVREYMIGDIVFAKMRPNLRKVALMDYSEPGYVSGECFVFSVKKTLNGEPVVDPLLLSILLRSDLVFGQIMHLIAGIGRPRIGAKDLREVLIPVPPKHVQQQIKANYLVQREAAKSVRAQADRLNEEAERINANSIRSLVESFTGNQQEL